LLLNCEIPTYSRFERKHYFYGDLPLGYQITQNKYPLAKNGTISVKTNQKEEGVGSGLEEDESSEFEVRVKQIQLEQDSGKLIYEEEEKDGNEICLLDLNRAGFYFCFLLF